MNYLVICEQLCEMGVVGERERERERERELHLTGLGMGTLHLGARAYMSYGYPHAYLDTKD